MILSVRLDYLTDGLRLCLSVWIICPIGYDSICPSGLSVRLVMILYIRMDSDSVCLYGFRFCMSVGILILSVWTIILTVCRDYDSVCPAYEPVYYISALPVQIMIMFDIFLLYILGTFLY